MSLSTTCNIDILYLLQNNVTITDPAFKFFIESLSPTNSSSAPSCEEKSFSDCKYINYYSLGLSIMTKQDMKTIDTVFCYSEKDKTFKPYCGPLPLSLSLKENNVQVLKRFNREPDAKGGGKYKSTPIWIEFAVKLESTCPKLLDITFNFTNSDWNDLENPIHFLTFFLK
ncbi:hypothetical protein C9374_005042 [Naegleria lovaniensis]|uniref:Uncharacterized protein n=1 Tax=Naegleria lovaniensis TaxID=51637 RepID=A0AA88GQD8_NAELO|nr:uncharacterized protein C9374_005042 [Naegleria lovaniensis]KAG2382462.1 hypothetical protein C9374_005042 [Naegleria lovaniensis]